MTSEFYKEALDKALEELASLATRRAAMQKTISKIDERIDKVRQGALGLLALADVDFQEIKEKHPDLFKDQIDARLGITDAVREVLRASSQMLTPIEIRDKVFKISPAIAGQKNPLASIHTVLRRLEDSDEILKAVTDPSGTTVYGWIDSDDWEERINSWFEEEEERTKAIEEILQDKERRKKKQ